MRYNRVGIWTSQNKTDPTGPMKVDKTEKSWDGVHKTVYSVDEIAFQKYYSRYRMNIQVATAREVSLAVNEKPIMTFHPEKKSAEMHNNFTNICRFIHFDHGFLDIEHVLNNPENEKSLIHHSYLRRWKTGQELCDKQVNIYHGQCNAFSLKWHRQPMLAPHPMKSANSSGCDVARRNEMWLRHCPQLGLFQIAPETVIFLTFPSTAELVVKADMKLFEFPPIGGLIYTQKVIFEGQDLRENYVDLSSKINEFGKVYENEDHYKHVKVRLETGEETNGGNNYVDAKLTSVFKIDNALPGFYLITIRLHDRVGQVFFDMNYVVRFRGKSYDKDEDDRQRNAQFFYIALKNLCWVQQFVA